MSQRAFTAERKDNTTPNLTAIWQQLQEIIKYMKDKDKPDLSFAQCAGFLGNEFNSTLSLFSHEDKNFWISEIII